jgi:hypothetical protein
MIASNLERRLRVIEGRSPRTPPFVITSADRLRAGTSDRLMTEGELDAYEAEVRASGRVAPGQRVSRVIITLVDPLP